MSRATALGTLVQRTGWGRRAVKRFVAGNTIAEAVAVAEYLAGRDLERVRPEVVRQIKSKLMSVRHNMDQSHGEEKRA